MTALAAAPAAMMPGLAAAPDRVLTEVTARVTEVEGLLARVAVLLNPYDVRALDLDLDRGTLRVVVEGDGFDAGRVRARLAKVIGVDLD